MKCDVEPCFEFKTEGREVKIKIIIERVTVKIITERIIKALLKGKIFMVSN